MLLTLHPEDEAQRVTDAALQDEGLLPQLSASVLLAARVILRHGYSVIILLGIIF